MTTLLLQVYCSWPYGAVGDSLGTGEKLTVCNICQNQFQWETTLVIRVQKTASKRPTRQNKCSSIQKRSSLWSMKIEMTIWNTMLIRLFMDMNSCIEPSKSSMSDLYIAKSMRQSQWWHKVSDIGHSLINFSKCPINFGWAGQNVSFTFVRKEHWCALKPTACANATGSSAYCQCITSCHWNVNLPKSAWLLQVAPGSYWRWATHYFRIIWF